MPGKSSRVWPPRDSVRSSAARATHRHTASMLRRSRARCQPGLNGRWPSTPTDSARSSSPSSISRASRTSPSRRMMPTRSFIFCWSSLVERVGVLGRVAERRQGRLGGRPMSTSRDGGTRIPKRSNVFGGTDSCPTPEHEQVGEAVTAEAVRPVHAAGDLTGCVEPGHAGRRGVGVDLDATHDVVARGADLHRLGRDVDVGQLLELVVHRRQPPRDLLGRQSRGHVEEDAAVRRAATLLDLAVDGAGHLVAREQLGGRLLFSGSLYQRSASSSVSAYWPRKTSGT